MTATLRFVVDAQGLPESATARVVRTNDMPFAEAVLDVLDRLRYQPALRAGQPVRQVVTLERGVREQAVTSAGRGATRPPTRAPC